MQVSGIIDSIDRANYPERGVNVTLCSPSFPRWIWCLSTLYTPECDLHVGQSITVEGDWVPYSGGDGHLKVERIDVLPTRD